MFGFNKKGTTIESITYSSGNMDLVGGKIYIDGKEVASIDGRKIEIHIPEGATVGNITSDAGISIIGTVRSPIKATSVSCDDVQGDINCKSIACGKVKGNITAEGNVVCGSVHGSITAKKVIGG